MARFSNKSIGIVIPENLDISRVISTGLSPKCFFVTGVIERMGVFYATTIGYGLLSRPRYLAYRASGRQLVETSTRGMQWGLAMHNPKAPAVPEVLSGCVVAQENPHVLLLQVATAVMLFVCFS